MDSLDQSIRQTLLSGEGILPTAARQPVAAGVTSLPLRPLARKALMGESAGAAPLNRAVLRR